MDAIAGYGSSSSDDDSEIDAGSDLKGSSINPKGQHNYPLAIDENVEDGNTINSENRNCYEMPKPILRTKATTQFDALVTFPEDYTKGKNLRLMEVREVDQSLAKNLKLLHDKFGGGKGSISFTQHLQSQKDFNKHVQSC